MDDPVPDDWRDLFDWAMAQLKEPTDQEIAEMAGEAHESD